MLHRSLVAQLTAILTDSDRRDDKFDRATFKPTTRSKKKYYKKEDKLHHRFSNRINSWRRSHVMTDDQFVQLVIEVTKTLPMPE